MINAGTFKPKTIAEAAAWAAARVTRVVQITHTRRQFGETRRATRIGTVASVTVSYSGDVASELRIRFLGEEGASITVLDQDIETVIMAEPEPATRPVRTLPRFTEDEEPLA